MNIFTKAAFLLIVIFIYTSFIFSFEYFTIADSDNQTAVTNSARNAMTEAVNLGNASVNEEITINEDVAIEASLRMYAASSDFYDGARYLRIYDVKSEPAMIAAESYLEISTPFRRMAKLYKPDIELKKDIGRSREIVIYEAKSLQKP